MAAHEKFDSVAVIFLAYLAASLLAVDATSKHAATHFLQSNSKVIDDSRFSYHSRHVTSSSSTADASQPVPPQLFETYMRYMPTRNTVICGCAKCGTSSMYKYLYETEFGHPWPYNLTRPYIHEVTSERWENKFVVVSDPHRQGELMTSAFTFGVIRDPNERIVSAWKSKVACGGLFHTDVATRAWMTYNLLQMSGSNTTAECLELDDFLEVLDRIHQRRKAWLLDRHFLPQHLNCFYRFPPEEWNAVVAIEDQEALAGLAKQLGKPISPTPAEHSSTSKVLITERAARLLNDITREEYAVFGEYLKRPSYVKVGVWV